MHGLLPLPSSIIEGGGSGSGGGGVRSVYNDSP